jgi:hypothetical protein
VTEAPIVTRLVRHLVIILTAAVIAFGLITLAAMAGLDLVARAE